MKTYQIILPSALLLLLVLLLSACDSSTVPSGLSVRYVVDGGSATISYADASGTIQTSSSGTWEHEFDAQPGALVVLDAVSTSSNPLTGSIFLNGELSYLQRGLHVRLEGSTSNHQSGEIEVRGFIEARTSNQVTVLGRTFAVDSQTSLLGRNNESVSFEAFRLGDFIEAEGRSQGGGTLRATKLKLEDGDDEDQVEVHGLIEARSATSVTVQGLLFEVDDNTRFLDDNNNPISFDAFQVGELVEAEGFSRPDGTYYAEKLKLDDH